MNFCFPKEKKKGVGGGSLLSQQDVRLGLRHQVSMPNIFHASLSFFSVRYWQSFSTLSTVMQLN